MNILGINDGYSAGVCVLRDGVIVAACEEERFTRRKNDPSFCPHSVDAVLAQAGLCAGDVIHGKPIVRTPLEAVEEVLTHPLVELDFLLVNDTLFARKTASGLFGENLQVTATRVGGDRGHFLERANHEA